MFKYILTRTEQKAANKSRAKLNNSKSEHLPVDSVKQYGKQAGLFKNTSRSILSELLICK